MILKRHFRHIDLPGWESVTNCILNWTHEKTDFLTNKTYSGWTPIYTRKMLDDLPELEQLFEINGFKITNISYFLRNDYKIVAPHSHVGEDKARINIPILNCQGTFTKFFQGNEIETVINNPQGMPLHQLKSFANLKEIASCEINCPTVLSVKTLHCVIVPPRAKIPRVMISVRVDPDPVYLLTND